MGCYKSGYFPVTHPPRQATGAGDLKGMEQFFADRKVDRGYVITKDITDFSIMPLVREASPARVAKIPAPLACYWLGPFGN